MNNKLTIASAGSGKTEYLVNRALSLSPAKILITTFTEANAAELKARIIKKARAIPSNVTIQTWFSFLLQHGIRPFQGNLIDFDFNGMTLSNGRSATYVARSNIRKYYFNQGLQIYSDKIADFIVRCDGESSGKVIDRISKIFEYVFVDEVQDLSGYDLDVLHLLFESNIVVELVGDPRQSTYSTSDSPKNKQYRATSLVGFFENVSHLVKIDDTSLNKNYRSVRAICDLSNKLYPDLKQATSGNQERQEDQGCYVVYEEDVEAYLAKYKPMQLRDSIKKKVNSNYPVMNFGASKGCTYDRVLIYATGPIQEWIKSQEKELKDRSKAKLYVAITRARFSVAFVIPKKIKSYSKDFLLYSLE
ncbi:MAG TPA: hypothetical protein DCE41_15830 [Cytophagales bacterium]|nr:hypothetical protein [Cytophagales bacterium]HAA23370.1 hypothetical protein [Cytophagales bacterium]HAP63682.1 hypothetical protein [Cytophagales bacterium]